MVKRRREVDVKKDAAPDAEDRPSTVLASAKPSVDIHHPWLQNVGPANRGPAFPRNWDLRHRLLATLFHPHYYDRTDGDSSRDQLGTLRDFATRADLDGYDHLLEDHLQDALRDLVIAGLAAYSDDRRTVQ